MPTLTLKRASQKLALKTPYRLLSSWWPSFKHVSLLDFIEQEPSLAIEWQAALNRPLLIATRNPPKRAVQLIFDGRLWHRGGGGGIGQEQSGDDPPDPVCWIISSATGKLLSEKDNISQLPGRRRLHFFSSFPSSSSSSSSSSSTLLPPPTPLWQLLNLETPFPDPQTRPELEARTRGIAVSIFAGDFCIVDQHAVAASSGCSKLILEAGTDRQYKIVYRHRPRAKDVPAWLELPGDDDDDDEAANKMGEDPCQTNRSTSVSLSQSSLNLAHSLGLVTSQERAALSQKLGTTVGSLAIHTDEENHLRHIFYRDDGGSTFMQEVTCFDNLGGGGGGEKSDDLEYRKRAGESMLTFWRQVWARKAELTARRRAILQPLLEKMSHHVGPSVVVGGGGGECVHPQRTLYVKCLAQLTKCIEHQWIVLYSASDEHIHSLKFYLTHFACVDLKKRSLQLKTSSDNNINALCTQNLTVFNIQTYLDLGDASQFYAPHWTPPPVILHRIRDLKHQPKTREGKTVKAVVRERAKWMSQVALNFWQNFVANAVASFGVDLHACNFFKSCSMLAFECVWTLFSRLAGPMAQGPEKMKAYYEEMLRRSSRGGFMYSATTLLKHVDAAACPEDGFETIMEYDLTSAYGFSASSALMPSGFCTGFLQLEEKKKKKKEEEEEEEEKEEENFEKEEEENWVLSKTDTYARHKSFEFRAVYYTLAHLQPQHANIRTVYSNFSPMGLFYVDKYPADLVIVYNDGSIDLYQFDGHYVHGCGQGCARKQRYVDGQTHDQVRAKTEKRDAAFEQWMRGQRQSGGGRRYIVVSDCHTPGYAPWSLEKSFKDLPELAQLVKGYQLVEHVSDMRLQDFQHLVQDPTDTSYTFIAWIEGRATQPCSLVVYHPDNRKNSLASATYKQHPIVLTRDYYNHLKATSGGGFHLTNIKAVLFFRTEPTMNVVYQRLIQQRATSTCPIQVAWIKRLVNLSCGFFGVTSGGKRFTFTLTNRLPRNYHYSRHRVDVNYVEDLNGGDNHPGQYFLLETTRRAPKFRQKNALAMFVTVVETGKLRLVQIIQFIARHLSPQHWILAYSNIDNLIIALRRGASLDEAVLATAATPADVESYLAEKPLYMAHHPDGQAKPGLAKLEWLCNIPNWQFITMMTQHYALVTDHEEKNVHKSSGWSSLSNRQAFDTAHQIMFGKAPVVIPQVRRVHKLATMATAPMDIVVQPKNVNFV
jgi:hypothetical protein